MANDLPFQSEADLEDALHRNFWELLHSHRLPLRRSVESTRCLRLSSRLYRQLPAVGGSLNVQQESPSVGKVDLALVEAVAVQRLDDSWQPGFDAFAIELKAVPLCASDVAQVLAYAESIRGMLERDFSNAPIVDCQAVLIGPAARQEVAVIAQAIPDRLLVLTYSRDFMDGFECVSVPDEIGYPASVHWGDAVTSARGGFLRMAEWDWKRWLPKAPAPLRPVV